MINEKKTILEIKTPRLNKPETNVLTNNRFNTYLVLIFSDLNKAQYFKMSCRVSSHDRNEIVINFNSLKMF